MSFHCEHTGEVVPAGIPEHRVVMETRRVTYENKVYKRGKPTDEIRVDQGEEVVREIRVSPEAYTILTGLEPRRIILPEPPKPQSKKNSRPVEPWRNPKNKDKKPWNKTKQPRQKHSKGPVVGKIGDFKRN